MGQIMGRKRFGFASRWLLPCLSLQQHLRGLAQTFTSQRATASLCSTEDCLDFELVLADFGVYPYGQLFECVSAAFERRAPALWRGARKRAS